MRRVPEDTSQMSMRTNELRTSIWNVSSESVIAPISRWVEARVEGVVREWRSLSGVPLSTTDVPLSSVRDDGFIRGPHLNEDWLQIITHVRLDGRSYVVTRVDVQSEAITNEQLRAVSLAEIASRAAAELTAPLLTDEEHEATDRCSMPGTYATFQGHPSECGQSAMISSYMRPGCMSSKQFEAESRCSDWRP